MNPFVERKILGHLPIVGQYLGGGTYPPIQVEIDVTNICTSACPWCCGYNERENNPFILFGDGATKAEQWSRSRAKILDLLKDLADYGVKSITWTGGGDPSVHPHISELVLRSHELGMDNGFITNGVIDVTALVPYCQWVRYSVDAATEDGYEKQHGKRNHFKRVLANVAATAKRTDAEGWETTIGVAFLTAQEVIDEIVPFVDLWRDVPVDYIQYRPILSNYGRHYDTDEKKILALLDEASTKDSRVVRSDSKYNAMELGLSGMTTLCHGTFLETAIAADGCVYTCCHLKTPQYALGSLHEESFKTIWERHLAKKPCKTTDDCSRFCRHYGTNRFFEGEVLKPTDHANFI